MSDEIMTEVRRVRDRYVTKHGHSLDAVYADLKKRETASGRRLVDLSARRRKQLQQA